MGNILTIEEVREALYLDFDFDNTELDRLSKTASSFINRKTGFDFGSETEMEPLAKQCAILYVRTQFFGADGYNKEYDFTLGINSLIQDLQIIAQEKADAEAV